MNNNSINNNGNKDKALRNACVNGRTITIFTYLLFSEYDEKHSHTTVCVKQSRSILSLTARQQQ